MQSVSNEEALALLSRPLVCQDMEDWRYERLQPNMARAECGLVDEFGIGSGLTVQLMFARSPKTKLAEYKLTVFKRNLSALQRVYQLQVNAVAHAPKNWHDMVHEHMGTTRIPGNEDWLRWGLPEALAYFCHRTNITFIPAILDPEDFRLTP